jgi:hypothetical protein
LLLSFLIIFSTIEISFLSQKALALYVTDISFGLGWLAFLDNKALENWYGQCLVSSYAAASLGTATTASPSVPNTITTNNLVIGGSSNNGLTSTGNNCAQQLQSYISQL